MITKAHQPNINIPIQVFGVEFSDLITLGIVFSSYQLLVGVSAVIFEFQAYWLGVGGILIIPSVIAFLRFTNRQQEKGYLDSWLAYLFFQPHVIRPFNPSMYELDPQQSDFA